MKTRDSRAAAPRKKTRPLPPAQRLQDALGPIIKGFERCAKRGDRVAEATAKALRSARSAGAGRSRKARSVQFARCSGCGDNVTESRDPKRRGGTAVHHLPTGKRCPGSDLALAAHAEIRETSPTPSAAPVCAEELSALRRFVLFAEKTIEHREDAEPADVEAVLVLTRKAAGRASMPERTPEETERWEALVQRFHAARRAHKEWTEAAELAAVLGAVVIPFADIQRIGAAEPRGGPLDERRRGGSHPEVPRRHRGRYQGRLQGRLPAP